MDNLEDVSVILNLQSDGPEYLDALLKSIDDENSKQNIVPFIKLYLDNTELFDDSVTNFVQYINENNHELWIVFSKCLSDEDILKYIKLFVFVTNNLNFDMEKELKFHNILITSDSVKKLFNKNTDIWDILFKKILLTFNVTSNEWSADVKTLQLYIKQIIIDKEARIVFIKWISSLLNIFIKKIHLNVQIYDTKLPTDYYIANIIGLLFTFWNEGITEEKILTLDYDYIISDKCSINWFDKKIKNDTKDYNFLTQCYFLILDSLRVGYIPILSRSLSYDKMLTQIDNDINSISTQASIFSTFILNKLYNEKQIVKNYLEIDTNIVKNTTLTNWIYCFYMQIISWINLNKEKGLDDILSDMVYFFSNSKDENRIYTRSIYDLINDIIITKSFTGNISIKCDCMKLFNNTLYQQLKNQTYLIDVLTIYPCALLSLHDELHHAIIRPDYKMFKKIEIYKAIDTIYINSEPNNSSLLLNELVNNPELTKKFIATFLMDLCHVNDTIEKLYKRIENNEENEEDDTIEDTKYNIQNIFLYTFKLIKLLDKFVVIFTSNIELCQILLSREIFTNLASIINSSINYLTCKIKYDPQLGFDDCQFEKELDIQLLMTNLINILKSICSYNADLTILVDSYGFNMENYNNFANYHNDFVNHTDISTPLSNSQVIQKIHEALDKFNTKNNIDLTDAPFEFNDPITYTFIEEPCLLPSMVGFSDGDVFFDKSTILSQLLVKEENPYTREHLTVEQFNKFNQLDEIKGKVDEFKNKINTWKKSKL